MSNFPFPKFKYIHSMNHGFSICKAWANRSLVLNIVSEFLTSIYFTHSKLKRTKNILISLPCQKGYFID